VSYSLDLSTRFTVKTSATPVMYNANDLADEAHEEAQMQFMEIAIGAVDLAVPMGGLTTIEAIDLISDQVVTLKINGGAGFPCKSLTISGAIITAITVSNSSGVLANLKLVAVGT